MLWGAGGALASGAQEALLYEELARLGAASSYPRVFGRARALGTTAAMLASLAAAPVLAVGGFHALGIASVAVPVLTAAVAWTLPEHRSGEGGGDSEEEDEEEPGLRTVLRDGTARLREAPVVRRLLSTVVLVSGFSAMDEFLPLLASEASGGALALVPLLVLLPSIGDAAGGWFAGRGGSRLSGALVAAALLLAVGAALRHPLGFVPIGIAFGFAQWTLVNTEARLQHELSDRSRATVTSLAGLGMEVFAVLVYAAYGLGSLWSPSWLLFALAALPQLLLAFALRTRRGGGRTPPEKEP